MTKDVVKSLVTELVGANNQPPAAGVDDGSIEAEKKLGRWRQLDEEPVDKDQDGQEDVRPPGASRT